MNQPNPTNPTPTNHTEDNPMTTHALSNAEANSLEVHDAYLPQVNERAFREINALNAWLRKQPDKPDTAAVAKEWRDRAKKSGAVFKEMDGEHKANRKVVLDRLKDGQDAIRVPLSELTELLSKISGGADEYFAAEKKRVAKEQREAAERERKAAEDAKAEMARLKAAEEKAEADKKARLEREKAAELAAAKPPPDVGLSLDPRALEPPPAPTPVDPNIEAIAQQKRQRAIDNAARILRESNEKAEKATAAAVKAEEQAERITDFVIIDAGAIEREYFVLDRSAVLAAGRAGKDVPGVAWVKTARKGR